MHTLDTLENNNITVCVFFFNSYTYSTNADGCAHEQLNTTLLTFQTNIDTRAGCDGSHAVSSLSRQTVLI